MLKQLKALFDNALADESAADSVSETERLQIASAILMLEVARTDHTITEDEINNIRVAMQSKFDLSDVAIAALMDDATAQIEDVIDFHQFTSSLNEHFDVAQKCQLIEYMWQVAMADGNLDAYEDHFIRKIADLLYLRPAELLSARERARKAQP